MKFTLAVCLLAICCSSALAFRVIKDVNSGKPLEEKLVLFEKGKPNQLKITDNESCKTAINADGSIESKIVGGGAVDITLSWAEPFNAKEVEYLILTCRLEGNIKTTSAPGKVAESRPDELWFGPSLLNAKGERVGGVTLAMVSDDLKTPDKTVTLKIPMMMYTAGEADSTKITGMTFRWDKTRPNVERDFRLVIDKIAIAN